MLQKSKEQGDLTETVENLKREQQQLKIQIQNKENEEKRNAKLLSDTDEAIFQLKMAESKKVREVKDTQKKLKQQQAQVNKLDLNISRRTYARPSEDDLQYAIPDELRKTAAGHVL